MPQNSSWVKNLSSHIDEDEMLELASRLIEINTVNPPGNECAVKDVLVDYFSKIGAKVEIFEPAEGRCSILGHVGEGRPSVAIISHMDVVPPGDGWEQDPFSPQVKDGRLYGRGAVDNKGPFAASWVGIKALLKMGLPVKGSVILGALADEERGSRYGMQYLLEKNFHPDFCIIPDGGKLNQIVIGEKGRMEIYIHTRGKSAHASQPHKGENAVYKMTDYLRGLKKFQLEGQYHKLFDAATINVGQIKGGQAPNIVPDGCEVTVDIRYPLGMKEQEILSQLKDLASRCKVAVDIGKRSPSAAPHLLNTNHPLVEVFKDVAEKCGVGLKLGTMGGITLAKNLHSKNIPAIVHSPAINSVAHEANEYVEVENLVKCAKIWAGATGKLLGDGADERG